MEADPQAIRDMQPPMDEASTFLSQRALEGSVHDFEA